MSGGGAFKRKSERPAKTVEDIESLKEKFIAGAKAEETPAAQPGLQGEVKRDETPLEQSDSMKAVDPFPLIRRTDWPITYEINQPFLADGRDDIDKPFVLRLKEDFWNSIDLHCAALGVSKSEWSRKAMERQLYEEQQFFLNNKPK